MANMSFNAIPEIKIFTKISEFSISMVVLYISDVAYSDGKTGDYLFLGNFVYTVSIVIFF